MEDPNFKQTHIQQTQWKGLFFTWIGGGKKNLAALKHPTYL
jgi:hypothetical protein